jgi:tRNA threonylcarbamoyladenosine biosynthesis protein TsaB
LLPLLILGIDSSDDFLSAGLAGPDGIIISKSSDVSAQNKNMLHSAITELMAESRFELKSINGVAISIGPGSFTGLRVGLAVAKGICWSLSLPLAGVSSLMGIAACASIDSGKILAIKDARRDEFYFAGFDKRGDKLTQEILDSVGPPDAIPELLSKGFKPTGPGAAVFFKKQHFSDSDDSIPFAIQNIGGAVAKLGRQMILSGQTLDTASAIPHYIRTPKAKEWNH